MGFSLLFLFYRVYLMAHTIEPCNRILKQCHVKYFNNQKNVEYYAIVNIVHEY